MVNERTILFFNFFTDKARRHTKYCHFFVTSRLVRNSQPVKRWKTQISESVAGGTEKKSVFSFCCSRISGGRIDIESASATALVRFLRVLQRKHLPCVLTMRMYFSPVLWSYFAHKIAIPSSRRECRKKHFSFAFKTPIACLYQNFSMGQFSPFFPLTPSLRSRHVFLRAFVISARLVPRIFCRSFPAAVR